MEEVKLYLLCRMCCEECPESESTGDYSRIDVGRTDNGLLISCRRHNKVITFLPYEWPHNRKCECQGCGSCVMK